MHLLVAAPIASKVLTTSYGSDAEDDRAKKDFLAFIEPEDQDVAIMVMRDAYNAAAKGQETVNKDAKTPGEDALEPFILRSLPSSSSLEFFSSSRSSALATFCNALLCGLARANDPALLDKAFVYLGKMRTRLPQEFSERALPSNAARSHMIRTCAILVRGAGLFRHSDAGERLAAPSPSEGPSFNSPVKAASGGSKYIRLSEMLFEEYLHLSMEAVRREPNNKALFSEYLFHTPRLLSSMIYIYCQARENRKAVALFNRLRDQTFPCSIVPDGLAVAGVIRAQAVSQGPLEAWEHLQELRSGTPPIEVATFFGLYKTFAFCILSHAPSGGRPGDALHALAHRVVEDMRARGIRPSASQWHIFMKVETLFADWERIQQYMAWMKEDGWSYGSYEYGMLIEALGVRKQLGLIAQVRAKMEKEGIPVTYVVYLSIIQAYRRAYDVRSAQAAFREWQREPWRDEEEVKHRAEPVEIVTTMMKIYAKGGLPEKAWALFVQYREGDAIGGEEPGEGKKKRRPDHVMYSVAVRVASLLGGIPMVEKVYEEYQQDKARGFHGGPGELGQGGAGSPGREGGKGVKKEQSSGQRVGADRGMQSRRKLKDNMSLSMLAAYVDAKEWGRAYEFFDTLQAAEEKEGIFAPIRAYNVMIYGLKRANRHEEARTLAEQAKAKGIAFDRATQKILASTAGAEELWAPPPHVYVLGGEKYRQEMKIKSVQGNIEGRRDLPVGAVVLDLHGLSVDEARTLLAREFEAMREKFDAEMKEGGEEAGGNENCARVNEGKPEGGREHAKGSEDTVRVHDAHRDGVQDLLLITGFRRRIGPGQGAVLLANEDMPIYQKGEGDNVNALQETARDFLGDRGIYWSSLPSNPGRLLVQSDSLRQYFERQRREESKVKFLRLTLLRYIPVTSLLALLFVVPKDIAGVPL